jgi:hypothetical protein
MIDRSSAELVKNIRYLSPLGALYRRTPMRWYHPIMDRRILWKDDLESLMLFG